MKRSHLASIALAGALLAALLPMGATAAAGAPGWVTTQLTTNADDHGVPMVSGDRVVWAGYVESWLQVFTQKVGTEASPIQLTTGINPHFAPAVVSGDRVAWLGYDGEYTQVFTRKMGTDASSVRLTTDVHDHNGLQVSNDRLAWSSVVDADTQVFTQKVGTDLSPMQLTSGGTDGSFGPQVSGDRVVWLCDDGPGGHTQVFTRKVGIDPSPVQLSSDAHDHIGLQVSMDRTVWRVYEGARWQVYTRKVGTDVPLQLTIVGRGGVAPTVSGDRVAWVGYDAADVTQIFTQKIGTEPSPVQITNDAHSHSVPQVSGDRVVWLGFDGAKDQVFTRKIGTDSSPVQLTTDAGFHGTPQVSGDRVVWVGDDGSHYQIFTASLGGVAPPVTLSTKTKLSGPSSVAVKKTLKLSGTVSFSAAPGRVTIAMTRKVAGKWRNAGSVTVAVKAGKFSYSFKPKYRGTWHFVARYSGGVVGVTTYRSSKSATKSVTVK